MEILCLAVVAGTCLCLTGCKGGHDNTDADAPSLPMLDTQVQVTFEVDVDSHPEFTTDKFTYWVNKVDPNGVLEVPVQFQGDWDLCPSMLKSGLSYIQSAMNQPVPSITKIKSGRLFCECFFKTGLEMGFNQFVDTNSMDLSWKDQGLITVEDVQRICGDDKYESPVTWGWRLNAKQVRVSSLPQEGVKWKIEHIYFFEGEANLFSSFIYQNKLIVESWTIKEIDAQKWEAALRSFISWVLSTRDIGKDGLVLIVDSTNDALIYALESLLVDERSSLDGNKQFALTREGMVRVVNHHPP